MHTPNKPPFTKPTRRGCACSLLCAAAGILIFAVIIFAFREHTRSYGFNKMSDADIAAYKKWIDKPIPIPPEQLQPAQSPDADLVKRKTELFQQAIILDRRLTAQYENPDPCGGGWQKWDNLTDVQNDSLLIAFQPVVTKAKALVHDPDYRLNTGNTIPVDVQPREDYNGIEALANIIVTQFEIQAKNRDTEAACRSLELMLDLLRCDPFISQSYLDLAALYGWRAASSASSIAARSTDAAFISQILDLLRDHRRSIFIDNFDAFTLSGNVGLLVQMHNDGYIETLNLTPRNLIRADAYDKEDYFRWLAKKIPVDDPRYKHVQTVAKNYGPDPLASFGPASLLVRGFVSFLDAALIGIDEPAYPMAYKQRPYFNNSYSQRDEYDAACNAIEARLQTLKATQGANDLMTSTLADQ